MDADKEIIRKEELRYFKKKLKEVRIEVRFHSIKVDLIQKLKLHPIIKDLNWHSLASIKVVISYMRVVNVKL